MMTPLFLVLIAASLVIHLHQFIQRHECEAKIQQLEKRPLPEIALGEREREFAHELINRYESELQKMGAELHDDLIQKLTVYRLYVDKLQLAESIMAVNLLTEQMKRDFQNIVISIRKISRHLLPDAELNSFSDSLRDLCRGMEKPGVAFIELNTEGKEWELPQAHRQHLLRVAEEWINNILKHSTAWHIKVRARYAAEGLFITIEDDGQGFSALRDTLNNTRSLLFPLRMRLSIIDASINFQPAEKGTLATIIYPVR